MTSIVPPNATALEKALDALAALRLGGIDVLMRALWSAENCPEKELAFLAWALSIDQWSSDWPLNIRRARVGAAIAIQRIKGSAKSVQDVIASFGGSVVLREWFQKVPRGKPHTFELIITLGGQSQDVPSAEFVEAVIAEVARTKPVRSQFEFTVATAARAAIGLRAVARPIAVTRLQTTAPPA